MGDSVLNEVKATFRIDKAAFKIYSGEESRGHTFVVSSAIGDTAAEEMFISMVKERVEQMLRETFAANRKEPLPDPADFYRARGG